MQGLTTGRVTGTPSYPCVVGRVQVVESYNDATPNQTAAAVLGASNGPAKGG